MPELPWFLNGSQARQRKVDRLLSELERTEARMRDLCSQLLEHEPHDSDLACEVRRLLIDLDR